MKRYLAYVRVSTARQGERGSSLLEQRSAIEAHAARLGLTIVRWFEERETAAKQGRRRFTEMLKELRSGRADGLIIHKIDRSARNLRDWADLGDLIDRGIDVRFVTDNFDLLSRGGRLSADIQAVVAADYIRNLRDEVKKGIYGRLKQGIYPFAAPHGYRNNGKGAVKTIDPVTGPLIKELFERYATGTIGFQTLRKEMWRKGLRTKAGKPLFPNTLTCILNNPFYMGVIRLGTTGETFAGAHEPLVSSAVFERVQAVLHGKTVPRTQKHRFLFRALVCCEDCGRRRLIGETQKGHAYYRCHVCPGVSWRQDRLEAAALAQICRIRLDEKEFANLRSLMEKASEHQRNSQKKLTTSLELRLARFDSRLDRLTDLLIDGAIDEASHHARRERLLMERQGVIDALKCAKCESPIATLFAKFERQNRKLLGYESLFDDEKRELLEIVSSNFSVRGKNVEFTLKSPYREIAETDDFQECPHRRDESRTLAMLEVLRRHADDYDAATTSSTSTRPRPERPSRQES